MEKLFNHNEHNCNCNPSEPLSKEEAKQLSGGLTPFYKVCKVCWKPINEKQTIESNRNNTSSV